MTTVLAQPRPLAPPTASVAVDPATPGGPSSAAPGHDPAPGRQIALLAFLMLVIISGAVLAEAVLFSGLQHEAAQTRAFASFRGALARGEAPVGQLDRAGNLLRFGTPVALLEVPAIGMHEVVGEGTTAAVLTSGPGHGRTSPLPGQTGTSVIMGRRAAFGGPFKRLSQLRAGAVITLTTGQGRSQYKVIDVRHAGDPLPPPPTAGQGRLELVTADGSAFAPTGAVYVDADLTTEVFESPPRARAVLALSERPLGTDRSASWALVLWLQVMIGVALGAVWSWFRWGRIQTWIVFVPMAILASVGAAEGFLRLLPNLT